MIFCWRAKLAAGTIPLVSAISNIKTYQLDNFKRVHSNNQDSKVGCKDRFRMRIGSIVTFSKKNEGVPRKVF